MTLDWAIGQQYWIWIHFQCTVFGSTTLLPDVPARDDIHDDLLRVLVYRRERLKEMAAMKVARERQLEEEERYIVQKKRFYPANRLKSKFLSSKLVQINYFCYIMNSTVSLSAT